MPTQEWQDCLRHALQQASARSLMTAVVIAAICYHAQGKLRAAAHQGP